ncbi:MAG: hypothetical protein M1826_003472 [Phylliscum demangeonii]|nr:MAG: hypothetical protein M1826_003472 [Phylliscum demangeonii]
MAEKALHQPTWLGIPIKHWSLVTLTFQNSALILTMHYSRIMPLVGGHRYHASTAVFLNEVMKLAICLTLALHDLSRTLPPSAPATALFSALYQAVLTPDCWKLAIPASLYTLQNTLQYVAVSNLSAATFQVTYQLKILSTAIFSVTMLGRILSTRRWLALILLTLGVAIVQLPAADLAGLSFWRGPSLPFDQSRPIEGLKEMGRAAVRRVVKRSATYQGIQEDQTLEHPIMNSSVGLTAVILACLISGAAGVYFEKVLKDSHSLLWIRNVQLSLFSLFPALFIGVIWKDGEAIAKTGFFEGYNWVVWTAIVFQALGGIVVALCVNYADNIAKNFATSISILFSFLASVWFFDFKVTINFLIGTAVVIYATYLYSNDDRPRLPPVNIAAYEKITIGRDSQYQDLPMPTTPLKHSAMTTSRPSSPMRHHSRVASGRSKFAKREE